MHSEDIRQVLARKGVKLISMAVVVLLIGASACMFFLRESPRIDQSASIDSMLGPLWYAEGNSQYSAFGGSVSSAGDVNNDGHDDVIIGAYNYENGSLGEGCAFLFLGTPSGLTASASWTAEGNQEGAHLGASVSSAGDVNNDGFGDVVIGARRYDNGETNEGAAFLYLGEDSPAGLSTSPAWIVEGDQTDAQFGWTVSSAGDVNGDDFDDVVVGAFLYDNGETDEGRVFLYLGTSSGLLASPSWTAECNQTGARFGASAASAGDVNDDGYDDVVIGADRYDFTGTDNGRAFLYFGSPAGLSASPSWIADCDFTYSYFGSHVSSAGDVNLDGCDDVIIGTEYYDNDQTNEGRAFLYLGTASGLSASPSWIAEGNQADAYFACSVSSAGDVDSDGYDDVVIGAMAYDNGQFNEGLVFLYLGSPSGLSASSLWSAEGNRIGAAFGSSVASAGDVNNDGCDDIIVGATGYTNDQTSEGRAYLYGGVPIPEFKEVLIPVIGVIAIVVALRRTYGKRS